MSSAFRSSPEQGASRVINSEFDPVVGVVEF